jgi:hypothetical protein
MNRVKLALKVQIIVITSFITISIKKKKSHLTSPSNSATSIRANHTDNNTKETSLQIRSKAIAKRNNISDTPKKKGKPRTKIKTADKTPRESKISKVKDLSRIQASFLQKSRKIFILKTLQEIPRVLFLG